MTRGGVLAGVLAAALCHGACKGGGSGAEDEGTESETETTTSSTSATDDTGTTGDTDGGVVDWPNLECDPLVPSYCPFPFPSNVFTVADDGAETGRRLAFSSEAAPSNGSGVKPDASVFDLSDGFSAYGPMLAHFPDATVMGLASPVDIQQSLMPDSPTVVIDAETGERLAHFAELDESHDDDSRRAFMIQPTTRMTDNRRYIVAIRNVVDGSGAPLPASEGFAALRDDTPHEDPAIEDRRALYEDIFARLEDAGVARDDLQLAWDFTTATRENNTAWSLSMRDEALELVGPAGPAYEITDVQQDWSSEIYLRIEGNMTVPLYLDDPGPGGAMVHGDDGMPMQTGEAQYPFLVLVPNSATQEPAALVQFGHGLLGSRYAAQDSTIQEAANTHNYVVFATDWIGMSEDDPTHIGTVIISGELHRFKTVTDRLQQGFINALLAMRMMTGDFAQDPAVMLDGASLIDTSQRYYIGGSLGGIMGSVYMSLTTDVEHGVLAVPGQPFSLLLNRSTQFTVFLDLLRASYSDAIDIQFVVALAQILWDRAEPSGYSYAIANDPLPGTEPHRVLMQVAIGDHQVTTLGAHVMARAIGATNISPVNREVWGLEEAAGPFDGSAMIEYDFGLPPEPIINVPMLDGEDPHGKIGPLPSAGETVDRFFRTGVVETFCDGPCDPQ